MKRKNNIDLLVEETLNSASSIQAIKTSPFLKDKVLNKMTRASIEKQHVLYNLDWFTIGYQTTILILLVFMNAFALYTSNNETSNIDQVSDFAEMYGLTEPDINAYIYHK